MVNIFNKVDSLNNSTVFFYLFYFFILILILSKFNLKVEHIIIFGYGIFFFYLLINNKFEQNNDDLGNTEKKLDKLPIKTNYLIRDKNLIEFLDFISEFSIFDSKSYNNLINIIDNFLTLENDIEIGVKNCRYDVENAIELKQKALNTLHGINHSIPAQKILIEKIKWCQIELDRLLTKHLNIMIHKCKIDSDSKPTNVNSFKEDLISNIKSYDPNFNQNYDYLV